MRRMSFTQEMKMLAKAGEGVDARGCREAVLFLHRELGRAENALGRAAWTVRYGRRGESEPLARSTIGDNFSPALCHRLWWPVGDRRVAHRACRRRCTASRMGKRRR